MLCNTMSQKSCHYICGPDIRSQILTNDKVSLITVREISQVDSDIKDSPEVSVGLLFKPATTTYNYNQINWASFDIIKGRNMIIRFFFHQFIFEVIGLFKHAIWTVSFIKPGQLENQYSRNRLMPK